MCEPGLVLFPSLLVMINESSTVIDQNSVRDTETTLGPSHRGGSTQQIAPQVLRLTSLVFLPSRPPVGKITRKPLARKPGKGKTVDSGPEIHTDEWAEAERQKARLHGPGTILCAFQTLCHRILPMTLWHWHNCPYFRDKKDEVQGAI